VLQWWSSEKTGKVTSPVLFWYLSLGGSFLFLSYGLLRSDPVIIIGQTLSYYIYIRNLQLKKVWHNIIGILRYIIVVTPLVLIPVVLSYSDFRVDPGFTFVDPMVAAGTIGQLGLNFRFVYQWYYSEKHKTSLLPGGFWSISVSASILVIVYSIFHPSKVIEPVLLISQSMGIFIYIRNMILLKRIERR
jgi:lipid-A-disaccharide synthase-like uncharacterized protein